MADDREVLRREFMTKLAGTGAAAGLASGCLGNGEENSDSNGEPGSNTGQNNGNQGNGDTNTGNPEQGNNQPAQENTNYEQNETEAEKGFEEFLNDYYDGWIELEEPREQIDQGSIEGKNTPATEIFEEADNLYDSEIEVIYLLWGEEDGDTEVLQLGGYSEYRDNPGKMNEIVSQGNSDVPEEDVEAVLSNVIEGYDDVSPNFRENNPEEYAEALGL